MDCRAQFRITYDQKNNGFSGESARSGFFKGRLFADFQRGEFCPSTLVICPALFGVDWSIRELVSVSTNLCLMSWTGSQRAESLLLTDWLREVTSTAESFSRSDSCLCGLPSVSTSLTFIALDLVVPFQPRWSAPPRLFTLGSSHLSKAVPSLRLSAEPRRSAAFFLAREMETAFYV